MQPRRPKLSVLEIPNRRATAALFIFSSVAEVVEEVVPVLVVVVVVLVVEVAVVAKAPCSFSAAPVSTGTEEAQSCDSPQTR